MINFRKFVTSSGLEVFGGRDSANNDKLVWEAKPTDVLIHTVEPGSPFVNVGSEASKKDIKEAAVFCAKFSQDWRDSKRDVGVNVFRRCDMEKDKRMKSGTWSVKKQDRIKVKAADILKLEKALRGEGAK
jgi:predicted ribosome quality control (RQC) complex YloA/Tae2 family protein